MQPTVISSLLAEVLSQLRARGRGKAAVAVHRRAEILETDERALRTDDERRRLILLADRVARVWVPETVAGVKEPGLDELAGQLPEVRSPAHAATAAQLLGGIRAEIRRAPTPARRHPDIDEIREALGEMQLALRGVSELDTGGETVAGRKAIPHAASGLIQAFFADSVLNDLPGEVANTLEVLDSLDAERTASAPGPRTERVGAEEVLHRTLVSQLASSLARGLGEVTHIDGSGALPQPPQIGRHRPDPIMRGADGSVAIGEAKLGPELLDAHSQEQLHDFGTYSRDGEPVAFHLIVPDGWRSHAEAAIIEAAGALGANVEIHTVRGLPGAPSPP